LRTVLTACAVVVTLSCAQAQDQERDLIDRLLRPDISLQNAAQNKKFIAAKSVPADKHASTHPFYVKKRSIWKMFSRTRDFSTWQFNARSFHGAGKQADSSSPKQIVNSKRIYSTQTARSARQARDANRTVETGFFSGNRPFRGEGKSQKSLDRQNPPLTIEQVRELLNKNK
jgi:hypothetical protein